MEFVQDRDCGDENDAPCLCAAGDWKRRLREAIAAHRQAGRIARVINVGRDVYEHFEAEMVCHRRFSGPSPTAYGVRLNYDPDFEHGLIEVK